MEAATMSAAEANRQRRDERVARVREQFEEWEPMFSPWRHGGWYVDNVRYASGAVGCVTNKACGPDGVFDGKWRIACDERAGDHTYRTRDDAARAERLIALASHFENA